MTKEELLLKVKEEAEGYFKRGEFFCSEAVAQTINNALGKPYDEKVIKLASGFPVTFLYFNYLIHLHHSISYVLG